MVVFRGTWSTLIYLPCALDLERIPDLRQSSCWRLGGAAHWTSRGARVVHISSGASALVCALLLGFGVWGHGKEPMHRTSMTYTATRTRPCCGSAGSASTRERPWGHRLASCAFAATHVCSGLGRLDRGALEWWKRGPTQRAGSSARDLVAGLACIRRPPVTSRHAPPC